MIYNYNTETLIPQTELLRTVRQFASQTIPTPALDREQVLQAITMACADLDAADPLILQHVIDTSAYQGQDAPSLINAIPATKTQIFGLYQPAVIDQDNLTEWDWSGPTSIQPHATITASSMLALIKWPYSPGALAEVNAAAPPAGNRAPVVAYAADPNIPLVYSFVLPVIDGQTIAIGERVLIGNAGPSNLTGIYALVHTNENEYTFQRAADADSAQELGGSIVAVQAGSAHAGTVWQIVADVDPPGYYHLTQIAGTSYIVYRCNFTRDQATAYIIPRAAAYLVHEVALTTIDKTVSQHLIDWATAILARPIPTTSQAISYRIQTATQYANS